jgi:uncharacterized membrane protein YedE/YeeE
VTAPWRLGPALVGAVFGFFLTASGLGDYRTIHRGLLLQDPYIYLMMAATVGTAWVGIVVLRRFGRTAFAGPLAVPRHRVRRQTVYGAAVFGVAFGVGATCPGITVAMLATGGAYGAVVLLGIFAGLWLRGGVEQRRVSPRSARSRTPGEEPARG